MNIQSSRALLACLSFFFLINGCSTSEKKPAPPPPTPAEQAAIQLNNERATYTNQTQARINQLAEFAKKLRTQAATAAKPQNKKMSNAADDLDSYLVDAKKGLDEVKTAAPQNWLDYKRDVDRAMTRAESQYSTATSLLR